MLQKPSQAREHVPDTPTKVALKISSGFLNLFFIFYFWLCHRACGILVPRPGIEPGATAVRAPSPNHWTARELLSCFFNRQFFRAC